MVVRSATAGGTTQRGMRRRWKRHDVLRGQHMAGKRARKRAVTITVRAEKREWEVINRAAAAVGKSRAAFVLDAALRAATRRPSVHRLVVSARSYRRLIA